MAQHTHEGTAQELTPFLARRPKGRFRLIEIEDDLETAPAPNEAKPTIDAENAAAIALLDSWRKMDAYDDAEELHIADEGSDH